MKYLLFISIILGFSFSNEEKELPPRFDLKKGINIGSVVPKNMNNQLYQPISEHKIDAIKEEAKNFIPKPITENDIIVFETTIGTFKGTLFNDKAPNHCLNFKKLANSGFYDGTKFHRVIPNFMIQGGDILSRDGIKKNDGTGNPGWTIDAEFNDTKHVRGILSMARSPQGPNTAGSQFFICVTDQPHLDNKYTAFGQINDKVYIIDHIVNTPTDSKQAMDLSSPFIPDGENKNNWIQLKNPKTRKVIYFKIPKNREKNEYRQEIMSKLRSDNPVIPIIIEKLRVINKTEL